MSFLGKHNMKRNGKHKKTYAAQRNPQSCGQDNSLSVRGSLQVLFDAEHCMDILQEPQEISETVKINIKCHSSYFEQSSDKIMDSEPDESEFMHISYQLIYS